MHGGDWSIFLSVVLAHALAVISPGPDFALVLRQSLAHGRAAGVWTAAGIGCGILFHVGYGLFGLGWVIREFPALLTLVSLLGGTVLIWIGLQCLRAAPPGEAPALRAGHRAPRRSFGLGLATNVLNAKAVLFFIALFSAMLAAQPGRATRIAIALWLPLASFAWFAALALLLSHEGLRRRLRRWAHCIDRTMGLILIALGIAVLMARLPA